MFANSNCSNGSGSKGMDAAENSLRRTERVRSSTPAPTRVGTCKDGRWFKIEKPFTGASPRLAQYVAMLLPVSTQVQWIGLLPTSDLNILVGKRKVDRARNAENCIPPHLVD